MPPIIKFLLNLFAMAVLCLPAAIAVSAIGRWDHRWPDLLAQFTAPALFATGTVTLLFALLQLRPAVVVGLAVTALLVVAVWPQWFPNSDGVIRSDAPSLTVYSANLWVLNQEVEAIAQSIAASDADVIVLIELNDEVAAAVDQILSGYPHRLIPASRSGRAVRSAIASRYPLTEIAARGGMIETVAASVETPLGPVSIVATHLTRPWPFQYQWHQINQARALSTFRAQLTGPVIVAGDFNSVSTSRIGRQVQAETSLIAAPGWPGTWPARLPSALGITIDQVWRSPDLVLLERRLGRPNGSDHRPVITRLALAQPSASQAAQRGHGQESRQQSSSPQRP